MIHNVARCGSCPHLSKLGEEEEGRGDGAVSASLKLKEEKKRQTSSEGTPKIVYSLTLDLVFELCYMWFSG